MKTDKRSILSFAMSAITALLVLAGIIVMITVRGGPLTSSSWSVFKYFTFQSNVFMGIIAIIYAAYQILIIRKKKEKIPHVLNVFNHVATTAVSLTFVIVIAFLAPAYGFDKMYNNANLFFHGLVPLVAMINYLFFEKNVRIRFIDTLFAMIPALSYGTVYFIVVAANNAYGDLKIDFYNFGANGPLMGAVNFISIVAISYTFGLFLYFINNVVFKKRK